MTADSSRAIKVILVGCGAVSQYQYAPALQALERMSELQVYALVDPGEPQRSFLHTIFPHASAYSDLKDCPVDSSMLVIIASPPKWHAEQTIFALRRGAAVLCEKPMASNSAEAETMLAASKETGSLLAVGLFRRFFPAGEMIKSLLENKQLGALRNFTIQEGEKFGWGAASDSYFRREATTGGVLYDIGVHVLDTLIWWFGEPSSFSYRDDAMGGLEANCLLELSYAGGERGTVRLSRDWETRNSYVFDFENGTVVYEAGYANRLNFIPTNAPFMMSGELVEASMQHSLLKRPTRSNLQSFIEQLSNVVGAMKKRESLRVPGEEGIRSLRLIEQCYANRTLIDMPWLEREEMAAAHALVNANR